jgi:hypothetical protein
MDALEALLDAENIQADDSLVGWARAFADSVLTESEVPPELLELLAKTPASANPSSSNTQPGIPHPAVAAGLTGIPRSADDPGSRPLTRDEGSGLRVIRSENIASRNEGSGLRVLPSHNEGSGLRALPPIPSSREGSGLRPLPTAGSGLHALPNPPQEDDVADEDLELLDADELEMIDDDGEDDGDTAASASMSDDRAAEPEWRRALDDAQSGVLPMPEPPPEARDDEPA